MKDRGYQFKLTLLSVVVSAAVFAGHAQTLMVIHIDTVRVVSDTVTRYHSVNGQLVGPRTYHVTKDIYQRKDGYNKIYRPNGKLLLEGKFLVVNDSTFEHEGIFKYYDANGVLDYDHDFNSHRRIYYFPDGTRKSEGPMSKEERDKKSGLWTCFYPNGKIKSTGRVLGELKYDKWKYFNEEGKLINRRHFKRYTGSGTGQDCCDW
jgi:antitoxin component YwqK of YwqJK toxin-antitoxin module